MAIVERDNVVLEIKDTEVGRYLDLGYNVTDGKGNILKESIPTDVRLLQKLYIENTQQIEALQKQIEQLKAELTKSNSVKVDSTESPKKRATKKKED